MRNLNTIECPKCGGSGKTEHSHIAEGICFTCSGNGIVTKKRVGELSEKAKIRKEKKEAKYKAELKESEERESNHWNKIYDEITKRNKFFLKNYKCATHENAMKFYKQVKRMSNHLGFDSNTTEAEVREMFEDFFKREAWGYRFEISKYTLKYHNFSWIDLDGSKNDLTDCEHEVQCMFKR